MVILCKFKNPFIEKARLKRAFWSDHLILQGESAHYFAASPQAGTTAFINGFNIFIEHANT